jgi:hypothetical protein
LGADVGARSTRRTGGIGIGENVETVRNSDFVLDENDEIVTLVGDGRIRRLGRAGEREALPRGRRTSGPTAKARLRRRSPDPLRVGWM